MIWSIGIMTQRYFLYHAGCEDGFASALVPWQIFGSTAKYLPVSHGEPPPSLPRNASVVITDFSYRREILLELANSVEHIVLLDHHQTAQKDLEDLEFAHFDMEKSGATLSWEYWHPNETTPDIFRYVEDRDLWKFNLEKSAEVNAAIASYAFDFKIWNQFDIPELAIEGVHILRSIRQQVTRIADRAMLQVIGGYEVPVVNTSTYASDILDELGRRFPDAPFAACFYDTSRGEKRWSLASSGNFDVGNLASELGGGGHYHRSGFLERY